MTALRQARWFATMVTCVAAVAWLVASNHCAVATLATFAKADHSCCHKAPPASPQPSTECCEAFNVPIPDSAAAPVVHFSELKPAWIEELEIAMPRASFVPVLERATGPPPACQPLEILLGRCIPAHAPPSFVA
jgi:hypothetical protein